MREVVLETIAELEAAQRKLGKNYYEDEIRDLRVILENIDKGRRCAR